MNQAIADLSEKVRDFLCAVHAGYIADAPASADAYMRRLREYVRHTGVDLADVQAWHDNSTNWRAVARLAGSTVTSDETTKAG